MKKPAAIALMLAALASGALRAQEQEPQGHQPHVAEVRFGDGSVVRMTLVQDEVEVVTKYGKLSIPLADVRRIEFGLHMPGGLDQQITTSIKLLGSEVYREREGATKELLLAGHWAYPSLQRASKSPDPEMAQRANQVLKQIGDKISPDLLRLKEHDVVHTREFAVVGRIATPTLKAHSQHFGPVALKLSDLRSLHVRQQCNTGEVFVDATKHGADAGQWMDTGITVDPSMRVLITGDGQVDLWPQTPGQYLASPKGYNAVGKGGPFMAGSLVGRIGEQGKPFLIGDRFEGAASDEGRLYLQITPSPWNTASAGSYRVRIHTDPLALTSSR